MSTPSNTNRPVSNPLNDYQILRQSTDIASIKITNKFTTIYTNYLLFNAENDTNGNINNLDNASLLIQNAINDIINIIKPCGSSTDPDKCTSAVCTNVTYVEELLVQYYIIFTDITSNGVKENYQFLPFLLLKNISDVVTDNKLNYDAGTNAYVLCANGTTYRPQSDNPKLEKEYNALLLKINAQVASRDTRQVNNGIIQFLLYILLPTAIFIILILLYVRHVKNSKIIEAAEAAAAAAAKASAATSDSIPIIIPQTTSEPAINTSESKTGGTIYNILGFITKIGLRFF